MNYCSRRSFAIGLAGALTFEAASSVRSQELQSNRRRQLRPTVPLEVTDDATSSIDDLAWVKRHCLPFLQKTFNVDNVYGCLHIGAILGRLSSLCYGSGREVPIVARSLGFTTGHSIEVDNLAAWVCEMNDVLVVAFRGTQNLRDAFGDANIRRRRVPGGWMHSGFRLAYLRLKDKLDPVLDKARGARVWLTGHSLGGALAVACGHEQSLVTGRDFEGIVTFGQPKLLGAVLRHTLSVPWKGRLFRFVNEADIVTKIPPNYGHVGDGLWFKPGGGFDLISNVIAAGAERAVDRVEAAWRPDWRFNETRDMLDGVYPDSDQRYGDLNQLRLPKPIRDHFMDGYLCHIGEELRSIPNR